ncbi:MAG: threonylcarbamoyl-AMP synthase [Nitrosopumilaceae archaeon]|nr:threonylcarbamoyl-AMP synthase [Nitrosopumilaceae archaeon]
MTKGTGGEGATTRVACDGDGIAAAARLIRDGGVIIFPTDTVYGIGCDPYNARAVRRIYNIKLRERTKPLPVLVDSAMTARRISVMDDETVQRMASRFWPGPLTMILDVRDRRLAESLNLDGRGGGIALRVPAHKCAQMLLGSCRMIAGTSANMSGAGSTGDPDACAGAMKGYDMILDGGVIRDPAESTVVDARGGRITMIREGGRLSMQEILEA